MEVSAKIRKDSNISDNFDSDKLKRNFLIGTVNNSRILQ